MAVGMRARQPPTSGRARAAVAALPPRGAAARALSGRGLPCWAWQPQASNAAAGGRAPSAGSRRDGAGVAGSVAEADLHRRGIQHTRNAGEGAIASQSQLP